MSKNPHLREKTVITGIGIYRTVYCQPHFMASPKATEFGANCTKTATAITDTLFKNWNSYFVLCGHTHECHEFVSELDFGMGNIS